MQVEIGVAVPHVDLDRHAVVDCAPHAERDEDRVGDPDLPGRPDLLPPGLVRAHHCVVRGPFLREAEAATVGGDGLDADSGGEPGGERRAQRLRVLAGRVPDPVRDRLGHLLQANDLADDGAGPFGHGVQAEDAVTEVAGLHQELREAATPEEATVHLNGTEVGPPGHVVLRRRERRQVKHRGAVGPDGEAHLRVEERAAGRGRHRRLGDEVLERRPVEIRLHDSVTVVVDQPGGLARDEGCVSRHRRTPRTAGSD